MSIEMLKNSVIHIYDENENYSLNFERAPTNKEKNEMIFAIRKIERKTKNKGKIHSNENDNPNLKQALSSINADEWTHAINEELKQMGVEKVFSAVTQVPPGKNWVLSQMILIRQRYANGEIKKY